MRAGKRLARHGSLCYSRTPMFAFIITLHVVVSIFLIFVILLQPGKGDAMAAFAGILPRRGDGQIGSGYPRGRGAAPGSD